MTRCVPESGANFADPRSGSLCGSKSHIGPSEHCGKSVHVLHRFPSLISCTKCLQPTFGVFHVSNTFGGSNGTKNSSPALHACARSIQVLPQPQVSLGHQVDLRPHSRDVDCFQATGSRFQGSSEEIRNTRRTLDTDKSRDDENARSAVLTTGYLTRLTSRKEFIASKRVIFKSQMSSFRGHVHKRTASCFQSAAIRIIRMARDRSTFCTAVEVSASKLQEIYPVEGTESTYVVPTIDFRAQVLSSTCMIADTTTCIAFLLVCLRLVCPSPFCNKLLVKQEIPCSMCDGCPPPPRFFAAWRAEALFFF